jgi:hypothetical protein
MRKILLLLIVFMAGMAVLRGCGPIKHRPGDLIRKEPEQISLKKSEPEIKLQDWTLKPLALFTVEARVLSKKSYASDLSANIAPYDLALGWGPMSNTSVLEKLNISQSARFYHWQYWGEPPIPVKEITRHSANMHLIPSTGTIRKDIGKLREGSLIKLSGFLVEAMHPKGDRPWKSSLTRDDSGAGACEVIYVRSLQVLR